MGGNKKKNSDLLIVCGHLAWRNKALALCIVTCVHCIVCFQLQNNVPLWYEGQCWLDEVTWKVRCRSLRDQIWQTRGAGIWTFPLWNRIFSTPVGVRGNGYNEQKHPEEIIILFSVFGFNARRCSNCINLSCFILICEFKMIRGWFKQPSPKNNPQFIFHVDPAINDAALSTNQA